MLLTASLCLTRYKIHKYIIKFIERKFFFFFFIHEKKEEVVTSNYTRNQSQKGGIRGNGGFLIYFFHY